MSNYGTYLCHDVSGELAEPTAAGAPHLVFIYHVSNRLIRFRFHY